MTGFIEEIARYVDGTLQDESIHARYVEFDRVPGSGRDTPTGWACDFDVTLHDQKTRITVNVSSAQASEGAA